MKEDAYRRGETTTRARSVSHVFFILTLHVFFITSVLVGIHCTMSLHVIKGFKMCLTAFVIIVDKPLSLLGQLLLLATDCGLQFQQPLLV
jgi:hypothetical protein